MTTRLQQSLRARLRELHEQEELWSAFAKAWAVECETGVPADAAALLEDCLGQGAFDVLGNILGLAPKLGKLAGGRAGTPEALQQVAIGICLVACERRVQEKFAAEGIGPGGEAGAGAADEMLIAASEQLAAAVIAAAWCENGVRIRFDEQTRTAEAINVLRDLPPQELDFQGPRDCVKAELQAIVKTPLDDLGTVDRRTLLQDVKARGVVSDDALLSQLTRYARKNDSRLMFGLNAASAHPLDEEALRKEFATYFGVPTFRYGEAIGDRLDEPGRQAWKRANLQADLMDYLLPLFERLSGPKAQARSGLQDMRFRVALSLAGEQREYVDGVDSHLVEELGRDAVFYYPNFEAQLARPNADLLLQKIYHEQADLVVVFLGRDYQAKEWCGGVEWRVVRELIKKRQDDRIMPFRFDDEPVDGLFSIDLAADCRKHPPAKAAALIIARLEEMPPRA
jgi:hypothetical protein